MSILASHRPYQDLVALAVFLVVVFAAAALGGWFTMQGMPEWYRSLTKPAFNPPDWIFGPVWTLLYAMMAVAAWLVWRRAPYHIAAVALALFALQLVLNTVWSALFFGMRSPGLAFGEILVLWGAILATTLLFWRVQPLAGALFVPYLLWVSFASLLNYSIWQLNS